LLREELSDSQTMMAFVEVEQRGWETELEEIVQDDEPPEDETNSDPIEIQSETVSQVEGKICFLFTVA
jgi:hypothetical protein